MNCSEMHVGIRVNYTIIVSYLILTNLNLLLYFLTRKVPFICELSIISKILFNISILTFRQENKCIWYTRRQNNKAS